MIAKGEYGDLVSINAKSIIAARGMDIIKGPLADWYAMTSAIFIEPVFKNTRPITAKRGSSPAAENTALTQLSFP